VPKLLQSGHALAAAAEGVTLHHVALFLVLWVPGASVALESEGLAALTPWRVLRVRLYLHAGILHGGEIRIRALDSQNSVPMFSCKSTAIVAWSTTGADLCFASVQT
jgi:hypothetical protein